MGPRPFIFCLVPADRADRLVQPLREHFARDPFVAVLVERRAPESEQRWVPDSEKRHHRAPVAERDLVDALPPELRREARHLRFVQRMEPLGNRHQDVTTEQLVDLLRDGDPEAASELWWRSVERVTLRLRARLGDVQAQRVERGVLGRILDELPSFDAQEQPFPNWLDRVVDRYADDVRDSD